MLPNILHGVGLISLLVILFSNSAHATTADPISLSPGEGELFFKGGNVLLDHQWTWVADGGLRVGLPKKFELGLPLALSYAVLREVPIEVALTMGVTDLWINSKADLLYTPAVVVAVKSHLSHEAAAFVAVDYTHGQTNFQHSSGYLRGAAAFMVDMGPYLSWCVGLSYQRILVDHGESTGLHRSGFAGAHRVSVGSVRATPFSSLPLFTIRTGAALDFTVHARLDIDTDTDTTDARFEGGIRLKWGSKKK